jgi:hypothetical protein
MRSAECPVFPASVNNDVEGSHEALTGSCLQTYERDGLPGGAGSGFAAVHVETHEGAQAAGEPWVPGSVAAMMVAPSVGGRKRAVVV